VIKNRKVILSFLFLAWSIIFAHSIVPHHHHFELISAQKGHCCHEHNDHHESHDHQNDFSITTEFDFCDHNETNHTCHFHVDVLTKVSVDNVFICTQENALFSNISCVKTNYNNFYQDFVSEEFPKTNYLRGPPSLA
jgi:hypothetical protein